MKFGIKTNILIKKFIFPKLKQKLLLFCFVFLFSVDLITNCNNLSTSSYHSCPGP